MIQSLYSAATGMKTQQRNIDTIANNISNANTLGYKQKRVTFTDALYQTMLNPDVTGQDNNLQRGHGAIISSITRDLADGVMNKTDRMLDFAISGSGYFVIETAEGIKYTRAGNFYTLAENDNNYLVTGNGDYVLDGDLNRITVKDDNLSSELGVFSFLNTEGLMEDGNNLYTQTEVSGTALSTENAIVVQGALESSNVNMTDQITNMIIAQRAYQVASRIVTISDEMEGMANNLRR